MRKFTVMIALLLVVALATPAIGASFPDVPSNHWAYEAINKLVAAGVIEGYPDGTYKGQRNLTRYEIAMIVSRVMDNMAEERAELLDKVESMEKKDSGLTSEQAQDVTAIVKALIEKNMPEEPEPPKELTDEQADQVVNLIEALTFEYKAELKVLRSDFDDISEELGLLEDDLSAVEERVTDLEEDTPPVTFSGSYSVDFTHKDIIEGGDSVADALSHYYIDEVPSDFEASLDGDTYNDYEKYVADVIEAYMIAEYDRTGMAEGYTLADFTEEAVNAYNDGTIFTDLGEDNPFADIVPGNTPYGVKEDVAAGYTELPMWAEDGSDAMAFTETTELTHTLTLNANIDYAGFEGQAGVSLEKLDSTDEVTFNSANLELENDELWMVYNEANAVDYSDFAVYDQTFNAAKFLYKPWGLNTFVGVDSVVTDEEEDLSELNGYYWEEELDVTFDGATVDTTTDHIVMGAQKTFALDMADVKVTAAGRKHPDWNTDKYFESLVLGAETEASVDMFDLSGDVAMSTSGEFEDYGYMLKLDGSTGLMDAFTVGANYKTKDEFTPLYGNPSVFDDEDAGYDKYGEGLDELDSGYGLSVEHDGSADDALVAGLDLGFGYDVAKYGEDSDTRIGVDGSMEVMDNLTVNGSYTMLDEPSGLETIYEGETTLYSVGAEFIPVENATVSGSYSVVDPVETGVKENTMAISGEYDFTDYVSASAGYTAIDGLGNYEDAEKNTTTLGVGLTDYPIMSGLTGYASVDYKSVSGKEYVPAADAEDEDEFFNPENAADATDAVFEEFDATTTALKGGLAYELSDRTSLTYDLEYTMQDADDEASDLYSGTYLTNAVGVDYTFTEEASLTADYKNMMMSYEDGDGADDWTAHQFEAGVSVSF